MKLDDPLRALRDDPVASVEDADRAAARRERLVPALARAIANEAHAAKAARLRRSFIAGAAVAAGVIGLVMGVQRLMPAAGPSAGVPGASAQIIDERSAARVVSAGEGAVVDHAGAVEMASSGSLVREGAQLSTARSGGASVVTSAGVVVDIDASSSVRFVGGDSAHERVTLAFGRATFAVPAGQRERSFSVETADATVTVHGTRFSVARADGVTRVDVTEGVVRVHHGGGDLELRAGGSWISGDATSAAALPSAAARPSAGSVSPRPTETSDLARQNAVYEAAMAAKRRGDDKAVIEALDGLLARWPDSPLAEEARRERARAAARLDP